MLKPLETEYRGRKIVLECTHKKIFPPPQMYGSTDEDIDNFWRQGAINQTEYQLLTTWREKCHLMVMGPRCLDCPLALKQNPRPGRPSVIETEPWLAAKERMRWEDMKTSREMVTPETHGFVKLSDAIAPPTVLPDLGEDWSAPVREPEDVAPEPGEDWSPVKPDLEEDEGPELDEEELPDAPEEEPEIIFKHDSVVAIDDDVIDALADD